MSADNMEKAHKLATKPHSVDFWRFDGKLAMPEEQVKTAVVKEKQRQ